jgi:hypothetical protein
MNKVLKTTLIVIAALVLAGGSLYAGWTVANRTQVASLTPASTNWGYAFAPGMMGGGFGRGGMMGGRTARGYGNSPGMMGGNGYAPGYSANITPLTVDQATQAAEKYLAGLNNADLMIAEVMIFDNNTYVRVVEQSTGIGAFELLVDPATQVAYPEYGPNMMWNLKYGGLNHQGMMGDRGGMTPRMGVMGSYAWSTTPADVSAEMPVSAQQALETAQKYLDTYLPGTMTATDADPFYGYYTIDTLRDGKIVGMLSVNGYNSHVFLHTWHGNFIEMSEE